MAHDIDVEIKGEGVQIAEITLDPNETVIAEAGAMIYMGEDISYKVKMGDGSDPHSGMFGKLFSAGKRMMTGEGIFLTHFSNTSVDKRRSLGFAGNIPGSIMTMDLAQVGGTLLCQRDAFLCAAYGSRLSLAFTKKFGAGFFGGEGFVLQKIQGDGKAILQVGGKAIKKQLDNETIRVDTGCLVGFTEGIDYKIEMAGSFCSMMFGGEGMFLATLTGTGTVILQSSPISKMALALHNHLPPEVKNGNTN